MRDTHTHALSLSLSLYLSLPLSLSFSIPHPLHPLCDPATQVIAGFLIARGPYWWLGYGWQGCSETAPYLSPLLDTDVGLPINNCTQVSSGVYARNYTNGYAQINCNSYTAILDF